MLLLLLMLLRLLLLGLMLGLLLLLELGLLEVRKRAGPVPTDRRRHLWNRIGLFRRVAIRAR